jgi:V/A-type H+/Na+-transporting ATPase subunit E
MAYEDLLKSVEESAGEKEQELRKKADVAVEGIRDRAKRQADGIIKAAVDEANRSIITERNKMLYIVKAENKEQLIKTREIAFELAFHDAEARLRDLRAGPKYPAIFEKLFREAASTIGNEAFTVHVDSRDEALCKKALAALHLAGEIRTDLTTAGGVVISLHDNTVVISNTIESRLERAKEHNRHTIHAILSGD